MLWNKYFKKTTKNKNHLCENYIKKLQYQYVVSYTGNPNTLDTKEDWAKEGRKPNKTGIYTKGPCSSTATIYLALWTP